MWQDLIIGAGGVIFTIGLFPSILSNDKPAFATSVINASVLFIMIITYASLGLWLSSVMNAVMSTLCGVCWLFRNIESKEKPELDR